MSATVIRGDTRLSADERAVFAGIVEGFGKTTPAAAPVAKPAKSRRELDIRTILAATIAGIVVLMVTGLALLNILASTSAHPATSHAVPVTTSAVATQSQTLTTDVPKRALTVTHPGAKAPAHRTITTPGIGTHSSVKPVTGGQGQTQPSNQTGTFGQPNSKPVTQPKNSTGNPGNVNIGNVPPPVVAPPVVTHPKPPVSKPPVTTPSSNDVYTGPANSGDGTTSPNSNTDQTSNGGSGASGTNADGSGGVNGDTGGPSTTIGG